MNTYKVGQKIKFGNGVTEEAAIILKINEETQTAIVKMTNPNYGFKNMFIKKGWAEGTRPIAIATITEVEA